MTGRGLAAGMRFGTTLLACLLVSSASAAQTPGPFGKSSPSNGAIGLDPRSVTLSWAASGGAWGYSYCIDTTNNSACDSGWRSLATGASVSLSGSTTYYWQVRAYDEHYFTDADNGTWWTFTTAATPAPGPFGKTVPVDASNSATASVTLTWAASAGATNYRYCVDTFDNRACDSAWISNGTTTSASVSLVSGARYYWQVVAENSDGITPADGVGWAWWTFTTNPPTPGAFNKLAPGIQFRVPVNATLAWTASAGAINYRYCIDTFNNNVCDSEWISTGTGTSAPVSLIGGAYYYWHVIAENSYGVTQSNAGNWDMFKTAPIPGDFTKDGKPDIIWQNSNGDVLLWYMNGAAYAGGSFIASGTTAWRIVGSADFTGDGQSDLLWQEPGTGAVRLWEMNGAVFVSERSINTGGTAWRVVAVGDFTGEGWPDIVWQDPSNGAVLLWWMQSTQYLGSAILNSGGTTWQVVGAADFTGDGRTDLLWQRPSDGALLLWEMNGTSYVGSTLLSPGGTLWQVVAVGDYNGDNNVDILWQHPDTGYVLLWTMNGKTYTGSTMVLSSNTSWKVRAPR